MLDPVQLASFLAVAQTRNFTEAGRRLGLQQSTVSQHVRKLEEAAGRRLFLRDTHSVQLTDDGEAMTGFQNAFRNKPAATVDQVLASAAAWKQAGATHVAIGTSMIGLGTDVAGHLKLLNEVKKGVEAL